MTGTEITPIHTDVLGGRYRLGDCGRCDYLRDDGSEYEYHHQQAIQREARYAEATTAAEQHGYQLKSVFVPPELEGELLLDSPDDALGAAVDTIDFVSESLGDHTKAASGYSPRAEHGVSLVLELAANQIRNVVAYQAAIDGLESQRREARGTYVGLQSIEEGLK